MEPDGHGTVTIRRGKTDQEGRGMVRYLAGDTDACAASLAGGQPRAGWGSVSGGRQRRRGSGWHRDQVEEEGDRSLVVTLTVLEDDLRPSYKAGQHK
jgi:hypothetical protein